VRLFHRFAALADAEPGADSSAGGYIDGTAPFDISARVAISASAKFRLK